MKIDLHEFLFDKVSTGIQLTVVDRATPVRPIVGGDVNDVLDWLEDYSVSYSLRWIEPDFNGGLILKVDKY